MSEEKKSDAEPEVGTIGRYSLAQEGGNDPSLAIDRAKQSSVQLQFPKKLGIHQFMMIFYEYKFNQDLTDMHESIVLPIPPSIIDKYGMEYNTADLGTAGALGASAITQGLKLANNPMLAKSGAFDQTDIDKASENFLTLGAATIGQLNPLKDQVNNPVSAALGGIVNPHTAVLFQTMKLKEFEFTWKLYPENLEEHQELEKIIYVLKKRSHPDFIAAESVVVGDDGQNAGKKYTNNAFLTYPCEVDLYYLGGGNQGMHRFKRCVITNLQINYTPEGGPAFVGGVGAPAFYELTLGFQETQIWTARDFALEVSGSAENEETTEAKPIRSGFSGSR